MNEWNNIKMWKCWCAAGLKFLVDLRADLRDCIHAAPSGVAPQRGLERELRCAGPPHTELRC